MTIDACYQLGYVIKKHGTKGEVSIHLDVDYPQEYTELESVFVELNKKLVPFFIERVQIHGDKAIVKFEDVNDQLAAGELKAKAIYLPLSVLPKLNDGEFYYHDIVDYSVEDKQNGSIGKVAEVVTNAVQDIIVVNGEESEILIPVTDEIVLNADHDGRVLHVNLPDGLLDIYLNQ